MHWMQGEMLGKSERPKHLCLVMLATKTNQYKMLYAYALRRNNEVVHHPKTFHTETLQKDIALFLTSSEWFDTSSWTSMSRHEL